MDQELTQSDLVKEIRGYISASGISPILINLAIGNLLFNFMRFHDFTGMQIFGLIRSPIVFTILTGLFSIPIISRVWPAQLKYMVVFLTVEAIRAIFGFFIFPNMVLNDAWEFNTWRDLLLNFWGILVPISLGFSYGATLRRMIGFFVFCSFALSFWGITHSGHGPGGHLGDENDLCLVLIFLLPFVFQYSASKAKRLIGAAAGILLVLGIAVTLSRGGFLGFVSVVFFQFMLSRNKIKWLAGAFIVTLFSLPFIPKQYYTEIKSIGADAKSNTGTIDERFRTWNMVIRMWKDPKNTLMGVGLENSRWNFKNYQEAGSGVTKKSLLGRATHSMYFQILGDLGVWGVVFFLLFFRVSFKQLIQVMKETKIVLKEIPALNSKSNLQYVEDLETKEMFKTALSLLESETRFISSFSIAVMSSWLGVLAAAAGISVLYYPTLWILAALSAATYLYWQRIDSIYLKCIEDLKNINLY